MEENKLPLSFYQAYDTCTLAQKFLGCELVHNSPDGITSGIIVETEAYLANDPACHAFNRRTARTEPMYGPAGTIYIYLIYGMYQCVNVVSNQKGIGEAVLIRALQPTQGIGLMQIRRQFNVKKQKEENRQISERELCRGPGKLVKAMGIERGIHNNQLLNGEDLYISKALSDDFTIVTTPRIGISLAKDLHYRYLIYNNNFTSR